MDIPIEIVLTPRDIILGVVFGGLALAGLCITIYVLINAVIREGTKAIFGSRG